MVHHTERSEQVLVYLDDSRRFVIETDVLAVGGTEDGAWIALRENVFHPQGGGQPADSGAVNGVPVVVARDYDTGLVTITAVGRDQPLPPLAKGDVVTATVDADARLRHAALHTAGHLIEALVQPYGWSTVGNNHFPDQARVEFSVADLTPVGDPEGRAEVTARLRAAAAAAIEEALPVTAATDADGLRTITIGTLHTVPCGGTHVHDLSELSELQLPDLRVKKGRVKASYSVEHRDRA